MTPIHLQLKEQFEQEIDATPEEYWPALLDIVRLYRKSVTLNPADISFKQGWQEAMQDDTLPLDELWTGKG
jgi:hypothetical protein